ncbi:MAG: hypothetical protein MUF81_11920 [Verrucomicrobia bacterium]|jgi:hypothetical protein|nr:hypothetical protein [Verrucomicrobiota bacterium]
MYSRNTHYLFYPAEPAAQPRRPAEPARNALPRVLRRLWIATRNSYHSFSLAWRPALLAMSAALALAGCGRDDIKAYQVPKESAQANQPAGQPDTSTTRKKPNLTWKTPTGWTEVAAGEMRVASFNVKNENGKRADVSVIPLSGTAGGDSANVNRWRGQVGLPPVPAEELQKTALRVEVGGQTAELHDVAGTNVSSGEPMRILGVIQHREGTAWFFKMTGDDQLVAQQKPAFIELLKSFQFVTAEEQATLPPDHPPIDATAAAPTTAAPADDAKPTWQVPSGWKEVAGGQFLVAKFMIGGGESGAQAAVNVSRSAGDGGGLAANVNRWRKQLGLNELAGGELAQAAKTIETSAGPATLIEMSGTDARSGQPAALVGAMVPQPGQTWFYKLMGDAKVVEGQKETFTKFVKEASY